MSEQLFHRNLLALAAANPDLGARLEEALPEARLRIRSARNGSPVPVFLAGAREVAFHSLIDPDREGERLAAALPPGGFVVALGLGGAYALRQLLRSPATSGILVIEHSAGLLRAILEEIDLAEILADPRVSLLLDPEEEELRAALLAAYIPPLAGDLRTFPLRPRTDLAPEVFAAATEAVRSVLGMISDDYSVQAFFGRLWFRNAVRNLFLAERPSPPLKPARRAVVTGAGPSLDDAIGAIEKERAGGAVVIATDTSLPALVGRGIRPDAVVSIDCQAISYYHFIKGIPDGVPLVLDLASPNRLARMTASPSFFSSGHPFCTFLSSRWRPFPALDTSGGNVSHAALSLAEALGAESILLAGADFSYPDGKSYARGTYIYDYFGKTASRLAPLESGFSGFVFRTTAVTREEDRDAGGASYYRYVTKPLLAYREHLERWASASASALRPFRGRGVEIRVQAGGRRRREGPSFFAAGRARESAADFLGGYARMLRALPSPTEPAASYLGALDLERRDLWTTLLPTASAFQKSAGSSRLPSAELLARTREWALREIDEVLAGAP